MPQNADAERCEICRFFHPRQGRWSVCRRYPPDATAKAATRGFPVVAPGDWCGEFQKKG